MSDLEEAARRVANGDREAFGSIVRATEQRLIRTATRLVGTREDAADVLQDAYLRAFDALVAGEFDGRSKLSTWLYRVVVNVSLDALRARGRRPTAPLDEAAFATADGLTGETRVALRELAGWLDALPEDQRAAIVLKELEGMSSAEIAQVFETSEGAIEQRLVRARATLRRRIDEG